MMRMVGHKRGGFVDFRDAMIAKENATSWAMRPFFDSSNPDPGHPPRTPLPPLPPVTVTAVTLYHK